MLLIHLGGTSIPGPHAPLLMVVSLCNWAQGCEYKLTPYLSLSYQTMDGKQGIQLVKLIGPKLTIPVHFDDYDVFVVSRIFRHDGSS